MGNGGTPLSPRGTECAPTVPPFPPSFQHQVSRVGFSLPPTSSAPTALTRILIVGAGGFGREVLLWARDAWPEQAAKIAGFLSADAGRLNGHTASLPVIADPAAFEPEPGDALLLAIGIPETRRRVAEDLLSRGAEFLTLIHPTAIVAPSASIGPGSIVCPYAIVSDAARLGRFTLMNYQTSLGHDASAGDYAVLSPYATLGGGAHIGDDVFLGLHASVGPGKRVGDRSKVSANSCALSDAPPDSLIFGAPGRVSKLLSVRPALGP
jgi:sugar O-acyltransferase (sialic acid O-acetyltransferase NeuD family)